MVTRTRRWMGVSGAIIAAAIAAAVPMRAQQAAGTGAQASRALTEGDYARAEKYMTYNTTPLVLRSGVRPTWLPDGRFWYRITTEKGSEAFLVDPVKATKVACDLPACAASAAAGRGAGAPPAGGGGGRGQARTDAPSPDGKRTVFIRDWNLWVRDIASGKETQLTRDGVKDFGYATDNAGWARSERPIVVWSPDSKQVATFQQDQRNVGEMYLVSTKVGHPELQAWKYPLPGDDVVSMIQRVVVDVDAAKVVRFKMEPDQHRSTLCDNLACRGNEWSDVQWAPDSRSVAFVSTSRDHRKTTLRIADPAHRRGPRRARGDGLDVLRIGQRARELALPAGVERSDLVLGARQLGPVVSLRPADRKGEAADHVAARATSRSWSASTRSADSCSCRRSAARRGATRISLISTR